MNLIPYRENDQFLSTIQKHYRYFNLRCKNIVFIEPYGSSIPLIYRGIENKFNIILLSANKDLRVVPSKLILAVSIGIQVDTSNEKELIQLITILQSIMPFHAVIPGFEYFVPIALKLSQYLKLPNVNENNIMMFRKKNLMRLRLVEKKIPIPKFCCINNITELKSAMDNIGYPAICKPIDAAGSVYVKKVNHFSEAYSAARIILEGNELLWGYELSKAVLIEEYIQGKEYSLEGIVRENQVFHFSITEKFVFDEIEFIEVGHIVNSPINKKLKKKMENYIEDIIQALGINHCPFHAEVRLNEKGEPLLIEIASRLAGDKIGELINLAREVNYYDYVYAAYLNEELPNPVMNNTMLAGIRFFYRPQLNYYSNVYGIDHLTQYNVEDFTIYYSPNHAIPAFPKPLRRMGHVIIKSDDYTWLVNTLNKIDKCIQFYI